jgi:enoyl-CoA hydratase/carnithine racemase
VKRRDPDVSDEPFRALRLQTSDGVARVTIDHPPLNLLDATLLEDLDRMSHTVAVAADLRVVVFDSADSEFFIAHADLHGLVGRGDRQAERRERLSRFAEMTERYRTMDQVTIAVIEGRARGDGSELVLALDMRFAATETAMFSQPVVALGITPGGGATQRLPRLTGRSRALEIILGCEDFDAELAERYGWINRALPAAELRPFVDRLARRISAFPTPAIAHAKAAVNAAEPSPVDALLDEHQRLRRGLATPEATAAMHAFLQAGGQTRDYEIDLGARLPRGPE